MKKIVSVLAIVLAVIGIWYFFVKQGDYVAAFKAKTVPGTIIESIKLWNKSLEGGIITDQKEQKSLEQELVFGDSLCHYSWNFESVNDSLTQVKVYVTSDKNSVKNRFEKLFKTTSFDRRTANTITDFYDELNLHLKEFKVVIDGEAMIPASLCAYIPLKGLQTEKAVGMMRNYPYLSETVLENNLVPSGTPFVEVTRWDSVTDSLSYNFCFPIATTKILPILPEIKFKKIDSRKALKATYNGNYITSDRAWYALMSYAKRRDINIDLKPIEIFYNNPNMGGNAMDWKAEVFLPIRE